MFPLALHKRAKNFQAKSLKRHERTKEGRTRAIKKSISRDSLPYRSSAGVCPDPGHATKPRGARGTAGCAHHHRSRSRPDAGQQLHPSPGDAGRGLHPRPHHLDCTTDPAHSFATSHQRTPGQPDGQRWLQRPNLAQLHPVCRPPAAAAKHATRRRGCQPLRTPANRLRLGHHAHAVRGRHLVLFAHPRSFPVIGPTAGTPSGRGERSA